MSLQNGDWTEQVSQDAILKVIVITINIILEFIRFNDSANHCDHTQEIKASIKALDSGLNWDK